MLKAADDDKTEPVKIEQDDDVVGWQNIYEWRTNTD